MLGVAQGGRLVLSQLLPHVEFRLRPPDVLSPDIRQATQRPILQTRPPSAGGDVPGVELNMAAAEAVEGEEVLHQRLHRLRLRAWTRLVKTK